MAGERPLDTVCRRRHMEIGCLLAWNDVPMYWTWKVTEVLEFVACMRESLRRETGPQKEQVNRMDGSGSDLPKREAESALTRRGSNVEREREGER